MMWDKAKALKELEIPEAFYDELVVGFLRQSEGVIVELEKALSEKNFEGIARAAHFIKGASGNLRIERIYGAAKELEGVAKADQDLGTVELRVKDLKTLLIAFKKNL